jgi:hypothetical protein
MGIIDRWVFYLVEPTYSEGKSENLRWAVTALQRDFLKEILFLSSVESVRSAFASDTFLVSVIMAPAYPKVRVKGVTAAMEMMRRVAAALEKALHFF